jgi:hypothetical protein
VLNTFADKVIIPIMGWVRNFHGYVFTDRRDGSNFGPKGSDAIDICCHLSRSWYYYMDDKQVRSSISSNGKRFMLRYKRQNTSFGTVSWSFSLQMRSRAPLLFLV